MTTVAAVVPMRHSSERVPGKNYRPLGGVPLYHHVVRALLAAETFDTVVIDTDSDLIIDDAARHFPGVTVLRRPEHLRAGEIPMNDVLANTVRQLDTDAVLQTHSTNPFLSAATIASAVRRYQVRPRGCDSVFGVTRLQARLWSADGVPINHDPTVLLRTQDLAPVYLENSCFYVFGRQQLLDTGNRIGSCPILVEVPPGEAIDIDEESDFALAEAIVAAGQAR